MSVSSAPTIRVTMNPQVESWDLAARTREFASQVYAEVAERYLQFRREYYKEERPSLDKLPPQHAEVHRAEIALLSEQTLRLIPAAVKSVPVLGGLLEHLERVADIHSISEVERTELHNISLTFLHGTKDGIQPWYAQWLLASARNLLDVPHAEYFLEFPWDACFYMTPNDLGKFEAALKENDISGIEVAVRGVADRLCMALKEPVSMQAKFAFTGPNADHRRSRFQMKTTVALGLGAILVGEEVRHLLTPRQTHQPLRSALAPIPQQLAPEADKARESQDTSVV